ncbi:hypothetical protein NC651_003954 [Populus alba x Populus x berolinensis]|nr:hypothetical protein NC651_003947 [Populus alba x Populus x berolinensis]KAJ6950132.1 hypothetical protein NC651_003954 [Populus alba x Populus x berolinensis]
MFTIQWTLVVLVLYVLPWLCLISTNQFVLCLDLNIVSFISLFLLVISLLNSAFLFMVGFCSCCV